MHIMLLADGRSPNTRGWVQGLLSSGIQVTLVSTYPCDPFPGIESLFVIPVAFAKLSGSQARTGVRHSSVLHRMIGRFRNILLSGRYAFGPLSIPFYVSQFHHLINITKPDIVHALRIPFEGMLAAYTPQEIPLVISIWGNDLTLHAFGSRWMQSSTRYALQRANGLMADANRDIRLAHQWGFDLEKPTLVVPGGGGIDLMEIQHSSQDLSAKLIADWPVGTSLVINPRGFRPGSVRNDVFFQSIPFILQRRQDLIFLCPGMAGQSEAVHWVDRLRITDHVRLLPYLSQAQLWDLFHRSVISVSISQHDGTPNSLLEAMVCACFPVAGDIESIREWITPGVNGMLVEPTNPRGLADVILLALNHPELRSKAMEINRDMVGKQAGLNSVRVKTLNFYQAL